MMNSNDVLFTLLTYFLFVFKVGPHFMEKRNPLPIKQFLIFYNIVKVINSAYLAYKVSKHSTKNALITKMNLI